MGCGAWIPARTAGLETHTTRGPRRRAQRGVKLRWVTVPGNLRGQRAWRPAPRAGRIYERSEASRCDGLWCLETCADCGPGDPHHERTHTTSGPTPRADPHHERTHTTSGPTPREDPHHERPTPRETHTTRGPAPRPAPGKGRTASRVSLWMGFKEICSKPIALAVDLLSSRAKLP
jgi:hypothetical protein